MEIFLVVLHFVHLACAVHIRFINEKKEWNEAIRYCESELNGTLAALSDITKHTNIHKKVWVMSPNTTSWISIYGCLSGSYGVKQLQSHKIPTGRDGIKQCSEICHHNYIAVHNEKCFCNLNFDDIPMRNLTRFCKNLTKSSLFNVFRILPRGYVRTTEDDRGNCAKVDCQNLTVTPDYCNKTYRFLCSEKRSVNVMTWDNGRTECAKKHQGLQSFHDRCKKEDGSFRRDPGFFWLGTFRPANTRGSIKLDCTFYKSRKEKLRNNCRKSFPFFCKTHITQPDEGPTSSTQSTGSSNPNTENDDIQRLIVKLLAGIVVLLLVVVCAAVVFLLRKRILANLKNKSDILTKKEQKKERYVRHKDTQGDIYEFHEINESEICEMQPNLNMESQPPLVKQRQIYSLAVIPGTSRDFNDQIKEADPRTDNDNEVPEKDQYDEFVKKGTDMSSSTGMYDHVKNTPTYIHEGSSTTAKGWVDSHLDNPSKDLQSTDRQNQNSDDTLCTEENEYDKLMKRKKDNIIEMDLYDHTAASNYYQGGAKYHSNKKQEINLQSVEKPEVRCDEHLEKSEQNLV